MRLPSTFFFRLDCHQAAIVVGFFDLFFHVPAAVLLFLLQIFISPDNVKLHAELIKDFGETGVKQNDELLSSMKVVQLSSIIMTMLMMYGVVYRKRWFMAPWFVWAVLDLLSVVLTSIVALDVILAFLESPVWSVTLLVILTLLVLGIEGYLALAVLCSFWEIGLANVDTPNRDSDISVQFQPIDHNRGGLV